ncbi:hypothetical protein MKZ38_007929 [Zalerion maritima]|uniref:Geranylgeranyl pyrophosphate synthetase n=1 Tax=Zalerion maritima TaxID=339359 RepID=A0AAD5WNX1_9PEZI|nr:hypothetical protein MKZ38_007929 [Zalerion maritima]
MALLAEIPFLSLVTMALPPDASITEFRHLASYNWIESPTPTIAVPGSPAKWSPPSGPTRLKKDTGYFYTAQNVARHPESPLEPLFRAVLLADPSVDLRSVDVVTDRNNIRKLLSFVDPGTARDGAEDFAINVEVVGETALFSREEKEVRQYIAPSEFRGHGHEFEKAYTKSQIHGSTGHHRIAAYRFGGLKFLVRNEVDGYVSPIGGTDTGSILANELSSLSLSKSPPEAPPGSYRWPGSKLKVAMEGETVPPERCLEVKTRVAHKPLQMQDVMPQLWASQTTKLVRAYHTRGLFQPPAVEDVTDKMKRWEKDNEGTLKKLTAVIAKILDVAKRSDGPVQVKYSAAGNQLVLSKNDSGKMLPDDLYSKWNPTTETKDLAPAKTLGMSSDGKGTIMVTMGGKHHLVDPNTIPLFKTVMASRSPGSEKTPFVHDDIPFFEAINYSVQNGLRNLFRRMPHQLRDYRTLCGTLDSLGIDVRQGLNLRDTTKLLKVEPDDYDPEERRVIKSSKTGARDAAFRFVYLLLKCGSSSQPSSSSSSPALSTQDRTVAYNAVSYVVSHRRIFGYRARKMVREAFEAAFPLTYKQRLALDKWPVTEPTHSGWQDEDETTDDDDGFGAGFDWDLDWS